MDAKCPRCEVAFEQVIYKAVTVDRCPRCTGHWFDAGELTLRMEILRPLDLSKGAPTTLRCVRCPGATLVELDFPGTRVRVDACPTCKSTWLDGGELEQLEQAFRAITGERGKAPSGDRTAQLVAEAEEARKGPCCPACAVPLEGFTRKASYLDRCPKCRGIWYDAGELTVELGVSRRIVLDGGRPNRRACPRCPKRALVEVSYPKTDIPVDVCPDCRGVFVEEDRLALLDAAVHGVPRTQAREGGGR